MYSQRSLLIVLIGAFLVLYFFIRRKKRYRYRKRYRNKGTGEKTIYRQRTHFNYSEAKTAEEKGVEGERFVATIELGRLPHDLFVVFNDVILPTGDGTTQVDHVVVADQGIFVIETKNYQGAIYGNDHASEWYQYLGDQKYPLHNPVHQNYGHVKSLSSNLQLPESVFVPIVVFPNQTKLNIETQNTVLHSYELADYIRNYTSAFLLTEEQMNRACEALRNAKSFDPTVRQDHIRQVQEKIREKDEKIAAGICPRCGGKLIQKNGQYGSFYGCSNYPRCQYTKK